MILKLHSFEIKQDDTSPPLETVLLDGTGAPIDLTQATGVTLTMAMCDHPRTVVLNSVAASYTPSALGEVSYAWQAGDTAVVGKYSIEWTVTFPGGIVMTVPSKGYDSVEVGKGL